MICERSKLRRVQQDLVSEPLQVLGQRQEMDLGAAGMVEEAVPQDEAHTPNRMPAGRVRLQVESSGGGQLVSLVGVNGARNRVEPSKRVVVTGGAGFIGSHLCEALLARDYRVTCVDNLVGTDGSTRNLDDLLDESRFELVTDSVLDWAAQVDLTGVDCIFHQAASKNAVALEDPELDLAVNGLGTLRLLLRAARDGVRKFVHASTGSVFGETSQPHVEGGPKQPVSLYGVSKLAGESYCRVIGNTFGLDYTVLRYYHVIGRRQDFSSERGGVVPIFARRCLEGRPLTIYGTGRQSRSFTAVHDVVRANLLVSESVSASRQDFVCASGVSVTIRELAEFVIAETGSPHQIEYMTARAGDIEHFAVDNTKLRQLGIEFDADWRANVRDVIAWIANSRDPELHGRRVGSTI
jgi:UDP-glucose 4-epimerase